MPKKTPQWSTIVPNTGRADRGDIRRSWNPVLHPELGMEGCQTLYEAFRRGHRLNPLGPCMGFRATSTTGMATPFIYSSYTECLARIHAVAAGLETMDLVEANDEGLILLGLYMKNCMEWSIGEHAVYCLRGATVPFYDTLGPETVSFILEQTETKSVVCTRAEVGKLCQAKNSGKCPKFQAIIVVNGVTPEVAQLASEAGVQIHSFAKVEAVGARRIATQGHTHRPPVGKDIATFCYTSGTTGNPKGALLTHENLLSAAGGIQRSIPTVAMLPTDRHLSYLPLPHIFERCVITQAYIGGASVAFFRGDPTLLIEDFQACRPTLMAVAPRVLNKIYDKIHAGINAAGGTKKKIFDAAMAAKRQGLKHGRLTHAFYDRLICNKIKKGLGMDCLRFMISGSAPLSEDVMTFFRCVLGVPVLEGYGQTEGAACATISHSNEISTVGHVGGPSGAAEVVLVDVPEMGYLHTDTNHRGMPCEGRGEICIRGPNVFVGYYKEPEKTREAIDDEGWLHSGDIGLWRLDGTLQIIDRKKNIFKLSQGEYVAPEKIENILIASQLIGQCFVYGDSLQSCLVALIVPDEEPVRNWAKSSAPDLDGVSFESLCASEELRGAIMEDIKTLSREAKLTGFETVKGLLLLPEPFTVENGLVTPTFKIKRQQVRDRYEKEIQALYASLPPPRSKL